MPHSAGGGSHGGGSHGGHGSGSRLSHSYFSGARRYRRHNPYTGFDDYVYSDSKPQKTGIGVVLIVALFGALMIGASMASIFDAFPKKLTVNYPDKPAIYDNIDVIEEEAALQASIDEYYELTGICTDIYTVYPDTWSGWGNLEQYAFDWYVGNFTDERHLVIVISYNASDAERLSQGERFAAESFAWEAIQGDDTDPIITETMFKKFREYVMDYHYSGESTGETFNAAFQYAIKDAHKKLDPGPDRTGTIATSILPLGFILILIVPIFIAIVKKYKKDKDLIIEEVPFTEDDVRVGATVRTPTPTTGAAKVAVGIGTVLGLVFMGFFVFVGIGIIIGGVAMFSKDTTSAWIMIGFGVLWTAILAYSCTNSIKSLIMSKKQRDQQVEMPSPVSSAAYGRTDHSAVNTAPAGRQPNASATKGVQVQPDYSTVNPEFNPQYFRTSSQKYDDDEDFKRKKRQGYE